MKTTLSLLVLFILVLGGGYLWSTRNGSSYNDDYSASAPVETAAATSTNTTSSGTVDTASKTEVTTHAYTFTQVSTHATAQDCWASINGGVYDLTTWISKHPGGEARILSICGKDGSSAFDGRHGSDPRALSVLAGFKIGTLAS